MNKSRILLKTIKYKSNNKSPNNEGNNLYKINNQKVFELDGIFLFNQWKNSFKDNYKEIDNFKKLVVYNENIKLEMIKTAAKTLLGNFNLKIFTEHDRNYQNYIDDILEESQFKNYNKRLLENLE